MTDPRSNKTTYVYDGFGDTIQQNSPDILKTIYYYDGDSNVTGKNESGINFSSATYDALDRLLTRTYPADSTLNVSITYDRQRGPRQRHRAIDQPDRSGRFPVPLL